MQTTQLFPILTEEMVLLSLIGCLVYCCNLSSPEFNAMFSKSLSTRISKYSATAASLLASLPSDGQILYTNLVPDEVVNVVFFSQYNIDLDQDGTSDFGLYGSFFLSSWWNTYTTSYGSVFTSYYFKSAHYFRMKGLDQSIDKVLVTMPSWEAQKFNQGDSISANNLTSQPNALWGSSGELYYYDASNSTRGNWIPGTVDKYLPVRIQKPGGFLYGWIRMDVVSKTQVIIKDYAVNLNLNEGIKAGDTATIVVNPVPVDSTRIDSELAWMDAGGDGSPLRSMDWKKEHRKIRLQRGMLTIETHPSYGEYRLRILNVQGKDLYFSAQDAGSTVEIDTRSWPKAMYVIQMIQKEAILNTKILLK